MKKTVIVAPFRFCTLYLCPQDWISLKNREWLLTVWLYVWLHFSFFAVVTGRSFWCCLSFCVSSESHDEFQILGRRVEEVLRTILSRAEDLIPKIEDVQAEKMGDMVDEEMMQTTKAIEQAAARIAVSFCIVCTFWMWFRSMFLSSFCYFVSDFVKYLHFCILAIVDNLAVVLLLAWISTEFMNVKKCHECF